MCSLVFAFLKRLLIVTLGRAELNDVGAWVDEAFKWYTQIADFYRLVQDARALLVENISIFSDPYHTAADQERRGHLAWHGDPPRHVAGLVDQVGPRWEKILHRSSSRA